MNKEIIILNNWEKAKQAIAVCKDIDEVKKIRDKAEALRAYAKQAKEGLEVQNNIADIKLRCERKIGEMIPKTIRHGGSTLHDVMLKDVGISEIQSHRYQSISSLPEKEFEKYITDVKASNEELTTVGVIKLARELEKDNRVNKEKEDRIKEVSGIEIRKGDFKKVLSNLKDIDAIITDPPYPAEFIDCFSDLSLFAKEHLKKDGFIAVYSGQYHLPEVIKRLSEHLTYVWTFCLYHTGKKQLVNGVNIMCGWKPVLIFSNGKKKMRYSAYDVLVSEQREKFGHEWQQSESGVYSLIDILTKPGELVVDPFAGSGTFLKVASENGRRAIGAEIK